MSKVGMALIMIGVMAADSERLIVPAILVGLGLWMIRRQICSR